MDEDYEDPEPGFEEPLGFDEQPSVQAEEPELEPIIQEGPSLFAELTGESMPASTAEPTTSEATTPEPVSRPEAPLALYRRYRPDTFAQVIGQDHVTEPLMRALDNNRVNHAYLFSGPRGCGKTTSARILARCLNCEQGPTSTPCGQCRSCQDLATGGPGSIDVIEIDAASHGGVDDARDLRERAFFAPVQSRYKVYIVDEAHMVTPAGFNALLKLVEEPPPHAKFVFATTEPDKVIGTIKSRTHHYPFRLVPPRVLSSYLAEICQAEDVQVAPAALPLVVRAGAGSVRDSLSVLDQLLGGSGPGGVSHEQAAALLGYTPDALLDEIMDAFAAGDAAGVFRTVDRVIEIGQDPRRFAEDLLRRLRDLVIVGAVPDALESGILQVPDDQGARLTTQAAGMGAGELTRAAEVVATGLTEMRGTTAPRLHLELMCARVLLPGADVDERGLHARMDRLERRVGMLGDQAAPAEKQWSDVQPSTAPSEGPEQTSGQSRSKARPQSPAQQEPATPPAAPAATAPAAASSPADAERRPTRRPAGEPPRGGNVAPPAPKPEPRPVPKDTKRSLSTAELRQVWPAVLEEVKNRRRFSYMLLSQNAQVHSVTDNRLTLVFPNGGSKDRFGSSGTSDVLADSIIEVIGVELRLEAVVADAAENPSPAPEREAAPSPAAAPATSSEPHSTETVGSEAISADDEVLADPDQAAVGLIKEAFGAEVIDES